jgi:DNA-binding CsgD family transcriptional regulator/tetratricopeptide (TPR) repeat protein
MTALLEGATGGLVVRGGPVAGALDFATHIGGDGSVLIHADAVSSTIPFGCLASLVVPSSGAVVDRVGPAVAALIAAVDGCGDGRGGVVVVDDAACVDAASSVVLAEASRSGVRLILVTGRIARLAAPLARLAQRFDVIELTDLGDAAVSELAASVLGGPVEPRVIRSLTRLVGGASAAIVDVLVAGVAGGALVQVGDVWRQRADLDLPGPTLERLQVVVDPLTSAELDGLDLVALGIKVPVGVLERLVGDRALVALEDRGLVELVAAPSGDFVSVVDAAVGSARLQRMGAMRRRSLARRLHEHLVVLEEGGAGDAECVTRAAVQLAADEPLGAGDAVEAARAARRAGELQLAIRLCEATRAGDMSVESTILLAELLTESGRNREAEAALRGLEAHTEEQRALIAMARAVNLVIHLDEVDDGIEVLHAAISELSEGPWMAEVLGLRGVVELMLGRPREAVRRVEPFLELASGREFVEAATAAAPALVVMGRCVSAAELAQSSLDERLALGDQAFLEAAGLHAVIRGLGLAESGRFVEADELTAFVFAAASDMAVTNGVMWSGVVRGRSLLDQGRYPEAVEVFELAASAALDLNLGLHLSWARGGVLLAVAQMGDEAAARRAADALDAAPPTRLALMASEVERARAWAAIVAGDLANGSDRLRAAADIAATSGEAGMEALALHDLVRIGRDDAVDRLTALGDVLEGELHAIRVAHGRAFAAGDAESLIGVADAFESCGALVLAAEALNHASWFERRNGRVAAAERRRARVAGLRGLRPWAATPGLASHPRLAELTSREREVAWLVAAGSSSKEAAQRLGVSVRTVDNLLQRVYRKLGIAGRADLRDLRIG